MLRGDRNIKQCHGRLNASMRYDFDAFFLNLQGLPQGSTGRFDDDVPQDWGAAAASLTGNQAFRASFITSTASFTVPASWNSPTSCCSATPITMQKRSSLSRFPH